MLRRLARFVGRVPLVVRVRAVRLLVKRVTVWKGKIEVETYETAAKDLQNAINGGGSLGGKFKSRTKNHRCPGLDADGSGTAVGELRLKWRLRRGRIEPAVDDFPVAVAEKVHYISALAVSWPVRWIRIACGEKVIDEVLDASQPADPV